jgi:uncharacterized membrane protein
MNRRRAVLTAALAGAMAASLAARADSGMQAKPATQAGAAAPAGPQEKCYGIAKGGQNDCASAVHDCAGMGSKKDNDPNEFKYVSAGSCLKIGGSVKPAAK